jgi:predicted nucleic acid-binding protein
MTAPCFVDANVLVYSRDLRDVRKREAARVLLGRLWEDQTGRISVQVLNEFYAVATGKLRALLAADEVWDDIETLIAWNPLQIDVPLLHQARSVEARFRLSWWDALIVAAAQLQGCRILYSEDLQHGAVYDSVQVRNPFLDHVNDLPPPDYVPAQRPVPHRPRGRPRKGPANP